MGNSDAAGPALSKRAAGWPQSFLSPILERLNLSADQAATIGRILEEYDQPLRKAIEEANAAAGRTDRPDRAQAKPGDAEVQQVEARRGRLLKEMEMKVRLELTAAQGTRYLLGRKIIARLDEEVGRLPVPAAKPAAVARESCRRQYGLAPVVARLRLDGSQSERLDAAIVSHDKRMAELNEAVDDLALRTVMAIAAQEAGEKPERPAPTKAEEEKCLAEVEEAHADFKAAVQGVVGKELAEKFLLGRDLVHELDKQVGKLPWPPQ